MSWTELMTYAFAGMALSGVSIAMTVYQGIRYNGYVNKRDIHESVEALRVRKKELDEDLAGLREELYHAQGVIKLAEEKQQWIDDNADRARELEGILRESEGAEKKLDELTGSLEDGRGLLRDVNQEVAEKRELLERLRSQVPSEEAVAEKIEQYHKFKREVNQLQEDLASLRPRAEQLERECVDASDRQAELLDQNSAQERTIAWNQQRLESLDELLDRRRSEIPSEEAVREKVEAYRSLERDLSQTQDVLALLRPQAEQLKEQCEELGAQQAEFLKQNAMLEVTLAGNQQRVESLEKQIGDLLQSKADLGSSRHDSSEDTATQLLWEFAVRKGQYSHPLPSPLDEKEALDLTIQKIEDGGLQYHQRVIRAFHTALKCGEESPLLVLAGISGTGKSALPERYAEAMGLHFLNVPVQPGWDSPADLLGFYNHLEGRFRPTELTRALLQMDYVHQVANAEGNGPGFMNWPASASKREALDDRMLLVLLDEMNLARVEYYFSEFLSRLEVRRHINPLMDQDARERAELVFDLGSVGEGKHQNLRTFVGKNVLFVGTMNEDESTQTLSDKVIDRSNVMRFGRPANLKLSSQEDSKREASVGYLPRRTWERWINAGQAQITRNRGIVSTWIENMNAALDQIGKPFAFRVSNAIHAYVAQYPEGSDRRLMDAFSDQIELRVLPRLRGIDLHDSHAVAAIETVTRFVDSELGDDLLTRALKRARDSSVDLFDWKGMDRLSEAQE